MATAITQLGKLQIGMESTKGTLVAATRVIPCKWTPSEMQERYYSGYPRGYRAPVGGGVGTTLMKGFALAVETELNAEDILWPLQTGIKGSITPTGAGADKTWVWAPELTTGIPTIQTATVELVESDGSTNQYYGEVGHAMTDMIGISYKENAPAMLKWGMFARARQSGSPTGSLTEYSSREPLVSPLLAVYLDTSYAGMGGTQLTGVIRAADWECSTGLKPKFTADARGDLDFTGYTVGEVRSTLKLTFELDATGAARIAAWRSQAAQYIRLKYTGNVIGSGVKTVQVDGAYRFPAGSKPDIQDGDNGIKVVSLNLESFYDVTGTKSIEVTVVNALTAI